MDDKTPLQLSRRELKEITKEAITEAFVHMGIDADDPLEMQRDFQHLRDWRRASSALREKGLLTAIGILVVGGMGALWVGFKALVQHSS